MHESARTRLTALREKKPPTKAAQIRNLWPEINAALDNGHSLKTIAECLAADGIVVGVRDLSVYVGRMRKNFTGTMKLMSANQAASGGDVIPSPAPNPAAVPSQANPKGPRDPLANIRERLNKRPAFDYRPELADPKRLI